MRKRNFFLTLTIAGLLISGCGAKKDSSLTAQTDTIIVTQTEGIIGYIHEEFDSSLYNFEELEAMIRTQVDEFNGREDIGGIEIRECGLDGESVRISLAYETDSDYELFNGVTLRCGEPLAALKAQFGLTDEMIFVDARDAQKQKTLGELAAGDIYLAVITDDTSNIRIQKHKIRYIMQGDSLVSDSEVDTFDDAALHIVIYEGKE